MNKPFEIYEEYRKAADFKSALGKRGLYEQNRINERFYIGDQWYGAKCGNDRPLVRHNIIKRIGDYKMSQILSAPLSVSFSAEGIPTVDGNVGAQRSLQRYCGACWAYLALCHGAEKRIYRRNGYFIHILER